MSMPPRPTALPVHVEGIPLALRSERRWLAWSYKFADGRWTKVPRGSTTNPDTWGSFEDVMARRADGPGFVLGDGWGGGDLDHCRDATTGARHPATRTIMENLAEVGVYVEVSPSGTGYKAFFRSSRIGFQIDYSKDPPVTLPWSGARYFTVTGHGSGDPTVDGNSIVDFWAPQAPQSTEHRVVGEGFTEASSLNDDALLLRIASSSKGDKFLRLWRGETSGYASHSEADLALCAILAFWCNYDVERVDRLFRLSDLVRPKWRDQQSYRRSVLNRACIRRVA